jgi:prevent-host-death family protein
VELPTTKARDALADLVNRAAFGGERFVLTRRGKRLAAVISAEDLELLEELERARDADEARTALDAFEKSGKKAIPWDELKQELDL